jgi:hypothetical protein
MSTAKSTLRLVAAVRIEKLEESLSFMGQPKAGFDDSHASSRLRLLIS